MTLLFFDDCPNWRVADDRLRALAREFTGVTVTHQGAKPRTRQEGVGFRGSPTILIDGVDPFATDSDPVGGLSCRVFVTPDGPAGSPTLEQLRQAFGDTQ